MVTSCPSDAAKCHEVKNKCQETDIVFPSTPKPAKFDLIFSDQPENHWLSHSHTPYASTLKVSLIKSCIITLAKYVEKSQGKICFLVWLCWP